VCVVSAKYLPNIGWVIAKNRDQDYVSDIKFEDKEQYSVGEILLMYDKNTGYTEGMNYQGLTIITASLTPNIKDETDRSDGDKIEQALKLKTPEEAAKYLVKHKLTGFLFICNKSTLVLIEAARMNDGKGEYKATSKVIPRSETVVRTNHGVEFPWAGFQFGVDEQQDAWRKSSERRKQLCERALRTAKTPEQMLDNMAQKLDPDLQMNLFRVENKPKQMRTIFQWALVPSEDKVYVRPIQCRMKLLVTKEKISIEVLDNKNIKKVFPTVKHLAKLVIKDNGKYIEALQENVKLSFKNFL